MTHASAVTSSAPVARSSSQTERLLHQIRVSGFGRENIPMQAAALWPSLLFRGNPTGHLLLSVPFATSWTVEKGRNLLFAPSHVVQVEWETGRLVNYYRPEMVNLWGENVLAAPVACFPHAAIAKSTVGQYRALRESTYRGYDLIAEAMRTGNEVEARDLEAFRRNLRSVMEPGLEPFCRKIAPKFFHRFLSYPSADQPRELLCP